MDIPVVGLDFIVQKENLLKSKVHHLIMNKAFKALSIVVVFLFLLPPPAIAKMVSIAQKQVNMRKGPSTKYQIIWELGKGYPLMVIGKKGKWLKVKDFENDKGWIYAPLTSRAPHLIVKKSKINIRKGPGKKYKIVGKASYGTVFRTLKRGKGWVKVKHENGLTGWVYRKLLWGW